MLVRTQTTLRRIVWVLLTGTVIIKYIPLNTVTYFLLWRYRSDKYLKLAQHKYIAAITNENKGICYESNPPRLYQGVDTFGLFLEPIFFYYAL
jgi:hypothetical protein